MHIEEVFPTFIQYEEEKYSKYMTKLVLTLACLYNLCWPNHSFKRKELLRITSQWHN